MNSENAVVNIEIAQTAVAMVALSDSGDHISFNSADSLWSNKSGYAPDVKPNGVLSGGKLTPGTVADTLSMAGVKLNLNGVETTVSGVTNQAVARPTLAFCTYAITISSAGSFTVVAGVESAVGLSSVYGADGGPPLIPTDSVLIGHLWVTSSSSGLYTAAEIKQIPNVSKEMANFPVFEQKRYRVENSILGLAGVDFATALPLIHTGSTTKKIFASYYVPEFMEISTSSDFVPPETSHSVSSTQVYGRTLGSSASSLSQGSFTIYLENGIADGVLSVKNEFLFFKFHQDRMSEDYILCQGKFGVSRTFPASDEVKAACTISAPNAAVEVIG